MATSGKINRREFVGSAASASIGLTIVPRNVLGGKGFTSPSDKLTIGYIGCGTQGLREMTSLITNPAVQIVAVCDPNKFTTDYVDWSQNSIRDSIRKVLGDPSWGEWITGIPGGRDVAQDFVRKFYAKEKGSATYQGCPSYSDFRELLEKEKDLDTIKIMTPDHLHATVAIASIKKGKHVVTHKPIANRIHEARLLIETAKNSPVSTHLLAWGKRRGYDTVKKWIKKGMIGKLKEIHNWSNRPVWQQWQSNPTDTPPIPKDFAWDLWLGPVPDRPYHPNYTHTVFRGWYDFGGGSIADMGHYSLFPLFLDFGIDTPPKSAEAFGTTTCMTRNNVAVSVVNDVAFPLSCTIRFSFPAQKEMEPFDLYWYDGGIRPMTPDEVLADGKTLSAEGMMFVGEKGKIVAGFRGEDPKLIPEIRMKEIKPEQPEESYPDTTEAWINAFRDKKQSPGSFTLAGPVTETILLGAVALRARKRIEYDTINMKITNVPEANKFLTREYRQGWEL